MRGISVGTQILLVYVVELFYSETSKVAPVRDASPKTDAWFIVGDSPGGSSVTISSTPGKPTKTMLPSGEMSQHDILQPE